MKKILLILLAILVLFIGYLLINTFRFTSTQVQYPAIETMNVDPEAKKHLSEAIQIQTVSYEDSVDFDSSQFAAFADFLTNTYPQTNAALEKKTFNSFSFLYKWQGKNADLKPIILMAHAVGNTNPSAAKL